MSALVNSPSLIAASPKRRPCSFCSCMTWATVSGVRRPARIRMAPSERSPGALAGTKLSTSSEIRSICPTALLSQLQHRHAARDSQTARISATRDYAEHGELKHLDQV